MLLPLVLFVSGLGLVAASIATGEAELSLLVVFPVVSGSGVLRAENPVHTALRLRTPAP